MPQGDTMTIQFVMKLLHKYGAKAYTGKGVSVFGSRGRVLILPRGEIIHIAVYGCLIIYSLYLYNEVEETDVPLFRWHLASPSGLAKLIKHFELYK